MLYDTWKSSDPADMKYEALESDLEELEQESPTVEQLSHRLDCARRYVQQALMAAERGYAMPWAAMDSLLTAAVSHLGCVVCGKPFSREDARTLQCVRLHLVHPGKCERGAVRRNG